MQELPGRPTPDSQGGSETNQNIMGSQSQGGISQLSQGMGSTVVGPATIYTMQHFMAFKQQLSSSIKGYSPEIQHAVSQAYQPLSQEAKTTPKENFKLFFKKVIDKLSPIMGQERIVEIVRRVISIPTAGGRSPSPSPYPGSQPPPASGPASVEKPSPSAAAANNPTGTKRPAEPADDPREGKKAKATARPTKGADEDDPDPNTDKPVDDVVDMEAETNSLMADIQRRRTTVSRPGPPPAQVLSEWRVANTMIKAAGLKGITPDCLDVLQLAFKAHASSLLQQAQRIAKQRDDLLKRSELIQVAAADPRIGVRQIENRGRAKSEAKQEAEQEALLRAAGNRGADDEIREKAQRVKAQMQGRQQASAANAALAATLGGGDKWSKWGGGSKATKGKGKAAAAAAAAGSEGEDQQGHTALTVTATDDAVEGKGKGKAAGAKGEGKSVDVKDLMMAMEKDPVYCRSALLYRLMNTIA